MATYTLRVDRKVYRALERAPVVDRDRLVKAILALGSDPRPDGDHRKTLSGITPPLYRLRAGGWRAIYRVGRSDVDVLDLIRRKDLDTWLRRYRG